MKKIFWNIWWFVYDRLPENMQWGYEVESGYWKCFIAWNYDHAMKRARKMSGEMEPCVSTRYWMI